MERNKKMKHSLRFKFIIGYFLIFATMLLLVDNYGRQALLDKLIDEEKNKLYDAAEQVVSVYQSNTYLLQNSPGGLRQRFVSVELLTGIRTWIVNTDGIILVDSSIKNNQEKVNLSNISPDFLSHQSIDDATIPNVINNPHLCVIYPVASKTQTSSYIVLLSSNKHLKQQADTYSDIFTSCLSIPIILGILIFAYLYFQSTLPLKKMSTAAKEYTNGHFDYPIYKTYDHTQTELASSIRNLSDKMKSMNDYQKKFIANVSHDFRSPLTSIHGYTEALRDGTIPQEMSGKYLDIILFETKRLKKLTENLLTLSQIENDKTLLNISSFELNSELRNCLATFEPQCMQKNISLEFTYDTKEFIVNADVEKIERVIQNLTDNAIKFSAPDSTVEIHTTSRHGIVFVSIKDHGIGIPKENIDKIWDRFYKTDLSRGKDKTGTGLGLSITKEIIEAHGEHINVISTEGVGTEFIFTLPLDG